MLIEKNLTNISGEVFKKKNWYDKHLFKSSVLQINPIKKNP